MKDVGFVNQPINNTLRIHVWLIFMGGKYTIHGSYGILLGLPGSIIYMHILDAFGDTGFLVSCSHWIQSVLSLELASFIFFGHCA